ncbi:MAG: hypothetical protein EOO92_06605 [Pedobacter sp.]|nr:MAG: hypothetical protein EOO92_06605 [Pedobacter sp.]
MNFKQKIAMALCAFYLISVIGIAMSMHFCSGKLSDVKFASKATCGACKGEKKAKETHDCCKSTSVDAKIKDSHEPGFKVQLPKDFSTHLFLVKAIFELISSSPSKAISSYVNKAPPLSTVVSLHIYNCVFRN